MTAQIISGTQLASQIKSNVAQQISQYVAQGKRAPGLAVILVGADPASQVYVGSKRKSCAEIGIVSKSYDLPETTTEQALLGLIEELNQDAEVNGILVQLPLPKHIDSTKVIEKISPEKDVDGFHPINTGHLWNGRPVMVPCTPAGIMELLSAYEVDLEGKTAVIIGRSNIVGKPMAQLLLDKNATVTLAHSRTRDLARVTKQADVLIVAIGQGHFVTKEFVKEDAVVIDVGMNRDENGKLIGDVKVDEVEPLASLITPVPGGVGPMTITMLMEQTYQSALRSVKA